MASPYYVKFPQSPTAAGNGNVNYLAPGVIASPQLLVEGQDLILNYLPPDTIPTTPMPNPTPNEVVLNYLRLPLGEETIIPQNARSVIIVAQDEDLDNLAFTVTGIDQFNNILVSGPTTGPVSGSAIEFQVPTGVAPAYGFNLYFHKITSISFTVVTPPLTVGSNVWAAIGGFGMTTFVGYDSYTIGASGSVQVHVPPGIGGAGSNNTWNYTVYGTLYPLYTPAQGGNWAPLDPNAIPKQAQGPANPTNRADQFIALASPLTYVWVEVSQIGSPPVYPTGFLTAPSSFTFQVLKQGV